MEKKTILKSELKWKLRYKVSTYIILLPWFTYVINSWKYVWGSKEQMDSIVWAIVLILILRWIKKLIIHLMYSYIIKDPIQWYDNMIYSLSVNKNDIWSVLEFNWDELEFDKDLKEWDIFNIDDENWKRVYVVEKIKKNNKWKTIIIILCILFVISISRNFMKKIGWQDKAWDIATIIKSYDKLTNTYDLDVDTLKSEFWKDYYTCLNNMSKLMWWYNSDMMWYQKKLEDYLIFTGNGQNDFRYFELSLTLAKEAKEALGEYALVNNFIIKNYRKWIDKECLYLEKKYEMDTFSKRKEKSNQITKVRWDYIDAWSDFIELEINIIQSILNWDEISDEIINKEDVLFNNANHYTEEYNSIIYGIIDIYDDVMEGIKGYSKDDSYQTSGMTIDEIRDSSDSSTEDGFDQEYYSGMTIDELRDSFDSSTWS